MDHSLRARVRRRRLLLLLASLSWLAAGSALAFERDYVLKWIAPDDPVDGFRLYVGETSGDYGQTVDLGYVAPDSDGLTRDTLVLDGSVDLYLALTAYNAAGESELSNEIRVAAALCAADGDCGEPTQCTEPLCDPVLGCQTVNRADGTACDDGIALTVDDQCLAGRCEGLPVALSVAEVVPGVVAPGPVTLEVHGWGFGAATALRFENGAGPKPAVGAVRVLDRETLVAEVRVRSQGPPRARLWDVVLEDPELGVARLEAGLRVEP